MATILNTEKRGGCHVVGRSGVSPVRLTEERHATAIERSSTNEPSSTNEQGPAIGRSADPGRFDVVVVGAGLAGLTAGATAARAGASVIVLDGRRLGGRAAVDQMGDGILFNRGAHALYNDGVGMRTLRDLGIDPTGGVPPLAGSWAYRSNGDFQRLPVGPTSLLRTRALSAASKVRAGALLARLGTDRHVGAGRDVRGALDRGAVGRVVGRGRGAHRTRAGRDAMSPTWTRSVPRWRSTSWPWPQPAA